MSLDLVAEVIYINVRLSSVLLGKIAGNGTRDEDVDNFLNALIDKLTLAKEYEVHSL